MKLRLFWKKKHSDEGIKLSQLRLFWQTLGNHPLRIYVLKQKGIEVIKNIHMVEMEHIRDGKHCTYIYPCKVIFGLE